jgi:hypothetical protein
LRNNFILDLKENPRKLKIFLNQKEQHINEIKIEYKKIFNPRTKWKSIDQRTNKTTIWRKKLKIRLNNQTHCFTEEFLMDKSKIFFKFAGTSPYPQKLKFKLDNFFFQTEKNFY